MVFKNCHLLQIQIITNAEFAPTICIFAIFYKICCYQMFISAYKATADITDHVMRQRVYEENWLAVVQMIR